MKVKLSPFTILFLILNSILIFCASRKDDVPKEPSSSLTHTKGDLPPSPGNHFDSATDGIWVKNTQTQTEKAIYDNGYVIHEKAQEELKSIMEVPTKDDSVKASAEQKREDVYGTFMDTIRDRTEVSFLIQIKIDRIANYSDLTN